MTTHARDQVFDVFHAVVGTIDGWASPATSHASAPVKDTDVPTADVRLTDEGNRTLTETLSHQNVWREVRTLEVLVTVYAKSLAERSSFLLELEKHISTAEEVGRSRIVTRTLLEDSDQGSTPYWVARQSWFVEYHIHNTEPDVLIQDG